MGGEAIDRTWREPRRVVRGGKAALLEFTHPGNGLRVTYTCLPTTLDVLRNHDLGAPNDFKPCSSDLPTARRPTSSSWLWGVQSWTACPDTGHPILLGRCDACCWWRDIIKYREPIDVVDFV